MSSCYRHQIIWCFERLKEIRCLLSGRNSQWLWVPRNSITFLFIEIHRTKAWKEERKKTKKSIPNHQKLFCFIRNSEKNLSLQHWLIKICGREKIVLKSVLILHLFKFLKYSIWKFTPNSNQTTPISPENKHIIF